MDGCVVLSSMDVYNVSKKYILIFLVYLGSFINRTNLMVKAVRLQAAGPPPHKWQFLPHTSFHWIVKNDHIPYAAANWSPCMSLYIVQMALFIMHFSCSILICSMTSFRVLDVV